MQARVSRKLHDRLEGLPQIVRDIAWKAQVRLCARYRRLAATGKPKVVVTTAIAREMVDFSGRSHARRRSVPPPDFASETDRRPLLGAGRGGNPRACYEPAHADARFLDRGSSKTKPRSCGNQPAHESLLNRRLKPCQHGRRPKQSAWAEPECRRLIKTLDGEHESRLLKKSTRGFETVNTTKYKGVRNEIELRQK